MSRYIAVLYVVSIITICKCNNCPPGEVAGDGMVRFCQPACPNQPPHGCPQVIGPTCLCPNDELRNWQKNFTCVSPSNCPKGACPVNEERGFGPPRRCQPQCGDEICAKLILIHDICLCKKGFVRDPKQNYKCVLKDDCKTCPKGEKDGQGMVRICQPSCPNSQKFFCPMIIIEHTCICQEGLVRDSQRNYTCVKTGDCSKN